MLSSPLWRYFCKLEVLPIPGMRSSSIDTASLIKSRRKRKYSSDVGVRYTTLPTRTFNKLREFRREMLKRRLRGWHRCPLSTRTREERKVALIKLRATRKPRRSSTPLEDIRAMKYLYAWKRRRIIKRPDCPVPEIEYAKLYISILPRSYVFIYRIKSKSNKQQKYIEHIS